MPHFPPLFDHSRHHHPTLDLGSYTLFLAWGSLCLWPHAQVISPPPLLMVVAFICYTSTPMKYEERYMVFVFLLFMLEAGVTADIFLNRGWEEDFPDDPTGRFDQFKEFVMSNFDICKWIGLSIACVQGLSLVLAMILKALGPHPYYDSDDEYVPERVPLLKSAVLPSPYVVGDPVYGSKSDSWNIRINGKVETFDSFNGPCSISAALYLTY